MKAKNIAESGILVALTLVVLYATSIIPISTLSVLTIASCLIPISIIRTSIKNTILVYIASSILSLFLVPTNIALYYSLFFGIYGILKHFIEKFNNIPIEIVLKLLVFNFLFAIIFFFAKAFVPFSSSFPLWVLWLGAQFVFLIYDYALTLVITYFLDKVHKCI